MARINPPTNQFDRLGNNVEVVFLPLEAIWPDQRFDSSRRRPKGEVSSGYTRFMEGDILLPKITPTFQANRTVIATNIAGGVGAATTEVHVIRVNKGADTRYIRYLLSSKRFLDEGEAAMVGVAGQKRIPEDYLDNLRIPLHGVDRQRAIADYLDTETARIDALIEKKQQLISLLHERYQVLVTTAVDDEKILQLLSENGQKARPLRAYAEVILGRQRSPESENGPHMTPYLRAANVEDGHINLSDVKEMNFTPTEQQVFALRAGDILVTEGSGSLRSIGASAVWSSQRDGIVCIQNTLLRLRPKVSTDSRFLAWWCRSAFASGLFASVATGANIFHLSAERVRALPMKYLPLKQQRAIADYLDKETRKTDTVTTKLRSQIELLREHRQALITAAVSGELDIPGAEA
jgi:restriction endonuclease S subunit